MKEDIPNSYSTLQMYPYDHCEVYYENKLVSHWQPRIRKVRTKQKRKIKQNVAVLKKKQQYMKVQCFKHYIPKIVRQTVQMYVPVEKKIKKIQYLPSKKYIIHRPADMDSKIETKKYLQHYLSPFSAVQLYSQKIRSEDVGKAIIQQPILSPINNLIRDSKSKLKYHYKSKNNRNQQNNSYSPTIKTKEMNNQSVINLNNPSKLYKISSSIPKQSNRQSLISNLQNIEQVLLQKVTQKQSSQQNIILSPLCWKLFQDNNRHKNRIIYQI